MYHTLEHVYSPKKLLREAHRILKPDGILIVEVPNIDSFSARFFGKRWMPLALPLHVNHFSPATLSGILRQTHFAIKGIIHSTSGASQTWKLGFKAVIRILLRREMEPSIFGSYVEEIQGGQRASKVSLRADVVDLLLDPLFIGIPLLERLVLSGSNFTIVVGRECSFNEDSENSSPEGRSE